MKSLTCLGLSRIVVWLSGRICLGMKAHHAERDGYFNGSFAMAAVWLMFMLATGCSDKPGTQNGAAGTGGAETKTASANHESTPAADAPEPYCRNWKDPAVVFAVSGQMHGYLEPCGCSEPQYGGAPRRAEFIRQMRERGWPVAAFDLGGTMKTTRRQSEFKFQTLMNALRDMRYEALAIGVEELRLGAIMLLSQHVDDPDHPERNLKFLAANIVLFGSAESGTPVPFKVFNSGSKKIAVTSVFDPDMKASVGTINDDEISILPVEEPLQKAVTAMQAEKPDLMVLLVHGTPKLAQELAKKHSEFPLVFCTSPVEDPIADNPMQIGTTTVVMVGHKVKKLTVVGWYPDDKDQLFRHEQVQLDGKRFPDSQEMLKQIKAYQGTLQAEGLAENEPAIPHPSGAQFVGAEKCGECHTKAYAIWKETGHAQAFESIRRGRLNIPRQFDPECLSCHATGWHPQEVIRYETGFASEAKTPHLLGSQCENCHGPGSRHIELINAGMTEEGNNLVRLTLDQAKKTRCYSCHDLDNSPQFKFEDYWPQIEHKGLD